MKPDFIIRVGDSLTLSLIVVEGDLTGVSTVSAVLKSAGPNGSVPAPTAPAVETFSVSPTAAPDTGWDFKLTDEETAVLKPGFYVTNARLDFIDGSVQKTEPVLIEIRGTVT